MKRFLKEALRVSFLLAVMIAICVLGAWIFVSSSAGYPIELTWDKVAKVFPEFLKDFLAPEKLVGAFIFTLVVMAFYGVMYLVGLGISKAPKNIQKIIIVTGGILILLAAISIFFI